MKYVQHIKTPRGLTIVAVDGKKDVVKTFEASSNEYAKGIEFIRQKKLNKLVELLAPKKAPAGVKVDKDVVWFNGEKLPPAIATKARQFIETGTPITSLKAFWERCKKNPVEYSRQTFYDFVSKYGVTILPDGRVLLYKGVKDDMTSHYDDVTLHKLGEPVKVDRKKCASTPHDACGYGLHCAPFEYVRKYYGRGTIIEVIVDPEHVTSVPSNEQKLRCCEYLPNCKADKKGIGIKTGLVTTAKKITEKAPEKPSSKKYVVIPFLESITIVGSLMTRAGFSPKQNVKVWTGRDRVIITPAHADDDEVIKRYKVKDPVTATTKESCSLRIRALIMSKHLGVDRKGQFKATVLEQNAIAIYKN